MVCKLYKFIDNWITRRSGYSLLDISQYTIVTKQQLSETAKAIKPLSRKGKKQKSETRYFYKNARALGLLAKCESSKRAGISVIPVLFRDADGTASSDRGEWEDKRQSMLTGFEVEQILIGVPMIPKPKSEAWVLCALRNKYENCELLEHESGNDASPNSLKKQLEQQLLGHELTHVVQQQAGKVAAPQGKGVPINTDFHLENQADVLGAKVAQGEQVQVVGSGTRLGHSVALDAGGVVQCQGFKEKLHKLLYENTRNFRRNLGEKSKGVIELGNAGHEGGEAYRANRRDRNRVNIIDPLNLTSSQTVANDRGNIDKTESNITSNYDIEFLVKKIPAQDAKTLLEKWYKNTTTILNDDNLDSEVKQHLEASERILKSMIELLDEESKSTSREVWETAIKSDRSEENTQAIAIVSLSVGETVVNYLATAPINIYGTTEEKVRGSGTSLMVAAIRKAKEKKNPVKLYADSDAVAFYENLGFQTTKEVGQDWEMELTSDRFDQAETYLKKKKIGVEAPDIVKAFKKFDQNFWTNLD